MCKWLGIHWFIFNYVQTFLINNKLIAKIKKIFFSGIITIITLIENFSHYKRAEIMGFHFIRVATWSVLRSFCIWRSFILRVTDFISLFRHFNYSKAFQNSCSSLSKAEIAYKFLKYFISASFCYSFIQ